MQTDNAATGTRPKRIGWSVVNVRTADKAKFDAARDRSGVLYVDLYAIAAELVAALPDTELRQRRDALPNRKRGGA